MAEKNIKARIIHKHEKEADWLLATNFIPKQGELIVYDIDDNYDCERIKIGDGVQNVNALPFVDDALRAELISQISDVDDKVDAVNTLVGDTSVSSQIAEALTSNQADWSQNDETAANYVKGRTHWVGGLVEEELVNVTVTTESYFSKDMGATLDIIAGKEYTVIHNGVTYNLVGENDAQGYGVYLGNGYIFSSSNTANDTPFLIFSYYSDFSLSIYPPKTETETVERHIVIKTVNTEIHKLDTMFIPDEIILGSAGAGLKSVVLNDTTTSTADGDYSYAGGLNTTASAHCASAHNSNTTASGTCSTAMGSNTKATEYAAFSSGFYTEATGQYSHAEGEGSVASGTDSHAEGEYTIAASYAQHAQGKFNIEDANGKYAHIVGNGERASSRSNAHTLDWDGNAWFAGDVYVGGSGQDDSEAKILATTEYVDSKTANVNITIDSELSSTSENAVQNKVVNAAISNLNALVGDTSVAEQIEAAQMVYVGPDKPTDPNIKVWINTSEEGTGVVPVLPRVATITLAAANWTGSAAPYSQVVEINTVTSATKVELNPTVAQIVSLQNDDIALMAENDGGTVTVYSFGGKPSADMTMQVTLTEVSYV